MNEEGGRVRTALLMPGNTVAAVVNRVSLVRGVRRCTDVGR
jgi:hypothetical protein